MDLRAQITIRNLACFGELKLPLGRSTLLLGRNGSGKSTLFDVLFQLRAIVWFGQTYRTAFPNYQITEGASEIELKIMRGQRSFRYSALLSPAQKAEPAHSVGPLGVERSVERECLYENDGNGEKLLTELEATRFRGRDIPGELELVADRSPLATLKFPEKSGVNEFKRWVDGIWLLRLEPRQMGARAEARVEELDVSGRNFAAWLLSFRRRKAGLRKIVQATRHAIEGLTQLEFVRDGRAWVLVARFEDGSVVDFDRLSDGQRCLLVLHSVLILVPKTITMLLLDEPDAHMTPSEILPLFNALQRLVEQRPMHLVVASHHPQLIDLMAAEAPWELVERDGGFSAEPLALNLEDGVSASRHLILRG